MKGSAVNRSFGGGRTQVLNLSRCPQPRRGAENAMWISRNYRQSTIREVWGRSVRTVLFQASEEFSPGLLPGRFRAGIGSRAHLAASWSRSPRLRLRRMTGASDALEQIVQAGGQRLHIRGLHRGEQGDPQLVAPQLAVRLGVDDPVRAQRRRERQSVH